MRHVPDAEIVLRWCHAALDGLAVAREEIDALNVFPVPDSDTGTNLYLTMEAATAAADQVSDPADVAAVVQAMALGAQTGARGNSGVILAQLLAGVAEVLAAPGVELSDGAALAAALERAAQRAEQAVADPVEGTILSVARAAAQAATVAATDRAAHDAAALPAVALAAATAAHEALRRTPDQLEVLRAAGVVDAGGRGFTVLLEAFDTVLTGRRALPRPRRVGEHLVPAPVRAPAASAPHGSAYEVVYLLDAEPDAVAHLKAELRDLGESLVVGGHGGTWNVHVHVHDAGAAVEAGIRAGRPRQVRIVYLAHDHQGLAPEKSSVNLDDHGNGRAIVAFAAGPGLVELFGTAGVIAVPITPGHRPATAEVLTAIRAAEAAEVVVLPNERDAVPVAEAAAAEARAEGLRVAVIPTVAQVQGLAAAAVHEPGRAFDADMIAMSGAAGHTRHGAVTVATREAVTMAGVCKPGDVLGVIEGDFAVIGHDLLAVATEVVARMLAAGGELVTVVTGDGTDDTLADGVAAAVRAGHPEAETVVYAGGQPRYPLLLGVE